LTSECLKLSRTQEPIQQKESFSQFKKRVFCDSNPIAELEYQLRLIPQAFLRHILEQQHICMLNRNVKTVSRKRNSSQADLSSCDEGCLFCVKNIGMEHMIRAGNNRIIAPKSRLLPLRFSMLAGVCWLRSGKSNQNILSWRDILKVLIDLYGSQGN
jgi:hypothetical protein